MKRLHRPDLYAWTQFDETRNIDFHSYCWQRPEGNLIFDPLPLSAHDQQHLESLGPIQAILISNSDHLRDALALAQSSGAEIWGPAGEKSDFPFACQRWLDEGDEPVEGLSVYALNGSKTPGELAFILDGDTLISGDLIRSHAGGTLCLLPNAKLSDPEQAKLSVKRLVSAIMVQAVLPGDGWPIFRHGQEALNELVLATL